MDCSGCCVFAFVESLVWAFNFLEGLWSHLQSVFFTEPSSPLVLCKSVGIATHRPLTGEDLRAVTLVFGEGVQVFSDGSRRDHLEQVDTDTSSDASTETGPFAVDLLLIVEQEKNTHRALCSLDRLRKFVTVPDFVPRKCFPYAELVPVRDLSLRSLREAAQLFTRKSQRFGRYPF
jgi:hypothetical protein